MSLSRHFKSSKSFQPEEIVKHDGGTSSGWKPLIRNEGSNRSTEQFTADKDPPAHDDIKKPAEPTIAPTKENDPPPALKPDPHSVAGPPQVPAATSQKTRGTPEEQIDLSKYVELTVADKQSEAAYSRGIKKGREEEHEKAESDFAAATRALLLACRQVDTLRETIISNSSTELLDFALAIAEKILRISVREQDDSIVATIEEALRRAVKSDEFSIYLHPEDYAAVSEKATDIVAGISGLNNVVLRKDKTIERGGAKIESDNCTIDATITSQFELIREEVKKNL